MILSIIIPVYNIESYLHQCIDSLLCSNKDYEIILVDDGSTDNSPHICDDYALKYKFIHSFHKENGGVSSARNYGIRKACGKYIYFVDGDDWVEGIETIFNHLDGSELFGVNYDVLDANNEIKKYHSPLPDMIKVNDYSSFYERHSHTLWAFVFKKEIIKRLNLVFCEDLKYAEDWVFVVNYLSNTQFIKNIHTITYKYRTSREGSAMNQKYDSLQVLLHFKAFDLINAVVPIQNCQKYYLREREDCFAYVLNIAIANLDILDKRQIQRVIRKRISLRLLLTFDLKYMCKAILAYINIGYVNFYKKFFKTK